MHSFRQAVLGIKWHAHEDAATQQMASTLIGNIVEMGFEGRVLPGQGRK
jgi:hypothetical protein